MINEKKTRELIIGFVVVSIIVGTILWYSLTVMTDNYPLLIFIIPVLSILGIIILARMYQKIIDVNKIDIKKFTDATNTASRCGTQASMLLAVVALVIGLNQTVLKITNPILLGLLILPPSTSSFSFGTSAFFMYFGVVRKNKIMIKESLSFYEIGVFLSLLSMVSIGLLLVLVLMSIGNLPLPKIWCYLLSLINPTKSQWHKSL